MNKENSSSLFYILPSQIVNKTYWLKLAKILTLGKFLSVVVLCVYQRNFASKKIVIYLQDNFLFLTVK
jgi:hypothetical protein